MRKIIDYNEEQRDKAEFACLVCRAMYKDRTGAPGNNLTCSCRPLGYYCTYIDNIFEKEMEK